MSIERELLERVVADDDGDFFIIHRLYKDIETFLAQPEQTEQEPVAWMVETHFNNEPIKEFHTVKPMERVYKYCIVTELYSAPPKQFEQNKAEAVMPNGVRVSNVYDAYEEGRKSVMSEQQPEAWMWEEEGDEGCVETMIDINKPRVNMYRENIRPLYIAPPVKSEHIEDKLAMFAPVGYLYKQMDCYGEWATIFKVDKPYITWHDIKDIVPVYTAPPKREPLSDEAVSELLMGGFSTHLMDLVRMIEKAHGIGSGE